MDRARYAQQSDRDLIPNFRRRWEERFVPRPALSSASGAEPGLAVLLQWRDEWRRRRMAPPSGREAAP
jgi:hypothetical protein